MRDLEAALGEGNVNSNVDDNSQSHYNTSPTTTATNKKVINETRRQEDAGDSPNTQQIDQLKEQFLKEDSQIGDNVHAQEHSQRWSEEAQGTNRDDQAQIHHSQKPSQNEKSTKETAYSQLLPPAGPLVSETQLNGLFEDTQFNKGFTKPSIPNTSKDTQDAHGRIEESQDTQYIDDLKQRLLEEETQALVGDSQPEAQAERVEEQQTIGAHKEEREDAGVESIKEHVPEKKPILSQADDTQFIERIKAQALNSIVDSEDDDTSQLEEVSAQDRRTVPTETLVESQRAGGVDTQRSDQVVLFPIGTSFDGGGRAEYTQSQFPSQNAQRGSFVAPIHLFVQSGGSQVAAQWDNDNLSDQPTSHPPNTTNVASSQPKITEKLATASDKKHNKREASVENINRLKTRAMDDWCRDSMGAASQTQANESGPGHGTAAKPESQSQNEEGSVIKKSRSSATHTQSSVKDAHSSGRREEHMDIGRTYNENESGGVRLDFTPSQDQSQDQAEESQNLQLSQDRGLKSPSYDFARQDDTSQLEQETPATGSKNPFAKSISAVPMGMSQVFAATQSSPLDPRFLQSEGLRPSSPDMDGLTSSPAVRRAQTLPAEASSPSHVELMVASSFQPFDESTQPQPVRKARLGKWKAETESQKRIEAQYAHFFVGRTEPGDLRFTETEKIRCRSAKSVRQKQKQKPLTYESDDGMDIEEENRKRIAAKRLKDKMEKNLREVGDMATGPRNASPPLDHVRRAASTGRVIAKHDIRGARLRERQRQSLERTTFAQDKVKKAEKVEVPASVEATKSPTARMTSRKNMSQDEEYGAQSEGFDAGNTLGTESQVIRSSQPRRRSQPEVVVDSQANISTQVISTQPDSTHRLLKKVEDSYNPPGSPARAKSKLGRSDSGILLSLDRKDTAPSSQAKPSPPGTSVPMTSSGRYVKNSNHNSTPGGSKTSNDTALEVVPETSPLRKTPSKTASPEKPFGDLSQVVDSPMKSFEDFPMTQEPPNQMVPSDITPSKFIKNTKKVYGKKSPVKKRPEQKMAKGSRVIFTEEPSEPSDNEQEYLEVETANMVTPVKKPEKAKRAPRKTAAAKKAEASAKSADMVVDDEDAMDVVKAEEFKKSGKRATMLSKPQRTLKSVERVDDFGGDAEEVLTPAKNKNAKPKSARFAIDDEKAEKVVISKKGRKAKTKIASPFVPQQSQLFCTQVPPTEDAVSPEKTRNRATKKTEPSPLGTAFDNHDGYDTGGMDDDGNPHSPQNLSPNIIRTIADSEAAKKVRKAGAFILDEESQDSEPLPVPMAKTVIEAEDKQVVHPLGMPVARMSFSPHAEENEDSNVDALDTLQQLNTDRGRVKGKRIIPRSLPEKALLPTEDKSPNSSPVRPPHRRSTRRQPSELQKQVSAPAAPTSGNQTLQPMEESDEDNVPIARTVTKRRQDTKIHDSSDTEMIGTSPAKKLSKSISLGKSTTLLPLDDSDEDEDESVTPVRPSIEGVEKECHWFVNGYTCTKDHSKDGLIHDEALKAISQKRRASLDIPSTASPGEGGSPRTSSNRDSRSTSAFTRPNSANAPHLPSIATGGRVLGTPVAPQHQVSAYATARRRVESSPLSEIASDVAEELEEFHIARATAATSRQESTDRSSSGTDMSDALLMPPPQTVTRILDFAAPAPERGYVPPVFRQGKGKRKRGTKGSAGEKGKKARKTTPEDTPSRPHNRASTSAAASPAAADDDDHTIVVGETPRASPNNNAPTRRQGRKASRPSYAESKSTPSHQYQFLPKTTTGPSTNGSDDSGPGPSTIGERTRFSRTRSSEAGDDITDRELGTQLFRGMAFAISYKRSDEAAVEDREEVTALILAHGGEVIEDFKDLFEKTDIDGFATPPVSRANSTNTSFAGSHRGGAQPNPAPQGDNKNDNDQGGDLRLTEHAKTLGFVAFIGDTYSRKSKFLQALALGLPCLSSFWIRRCIATKSILQWTGPYMLQAGEPRKMHGMVVARFIQPYSAIIAKFENTFRDRKKMLKGMGVLFLFSKSGRGKAGADNQLKREHYLWLTRALGARSVRRVHTAAEARKLITEVESEIAGWDIVYVDDGEKLGAVKRDVRTSEQRRKVRVVGDEFVVQSLILGGLEDEDLKDENWQEIVEQGGRCR